MIGKAKSISHTANGINYALNKQGAIEVSRNKIVGQTGTKIAKEFRVFQNLNARCERNSLSVVVSPTIPDGNKLSNAGFARLADDFLERMNLKEHQFISVLHSDEKHKHLHIFVNRIDFDGKAYKDHFISKKAQRIAQSVAKGWGFTTAQEIQQKKEDRLCLQIKDAHEKIIVKMPRDIFDYAEQMNLFGIQMHLKQASDGKVVGIKFQIGNDSIKASSVHRSFSAARLQKLILQNFEQHNRNYQTYHRNKVQSRKNKFRI